jgi:Ca-activated chloride channel homolog
MISNPTRKKELFLILAAILATSTALPGQQQRARRVTGTPQQSTQTEQRPANQSGDEVDDGDVVRVDTQLVSVPVVVTNPDGRPVGALKPHNFSLFEDGRLQKITNFTTTEAPFEVALLLDTSGSTRSDLALIKQAANLYIDALRPADRLAIIAFKTGEDAAGKLATVDIKSSLTEDKAELRAAVESLTTSNGTPFYDAVRTVVEEIFREPPSEQLKGRRALVALTDGVDSSSDSDFQEIRPSLMGSGIACYFVQINTEDFVEDRLMRDCADNGTLRLSRRQLLRFQKIYAPRHDPSDYMNFCQLGMFERMHISRTLYQMARKEMDELAKLSGGKTFPAQDLRAARRAFSQVAADIGMQYSLGYYPSNKLRDGSFRKIRVELKGIRGAQVRAREGYYAPNS